MVETNEKKDTVEKEFVAFPDIAADVINVLLHQGEKVVNKAALIRMIKVLSGETDIEGIEAWMEEQGVREEDEVTVCELFDQYVRQGRAEGMAQGRVEGRAEGENRFARLVKQLMDGGRSEDLRRAVSERNYREQLYMEADLA